MDNRLKTGTMQSSGCCCHSGYDHSKYGRQVTVKHRYIQLFSCQTVSPSVTVFGNMNEVSF